MAIADEGRLAARREAPLHVQIELVGIPTPCPDGPVSIRGRVVTVFRGRSLATAGTVIEFPLWVVRADEPTGPAFVYCDDLAKATHMELFLYGHPPRCKLAAYEFALIPGPSATPVLSIADLQDDEPRPCQASSAKRNRWWQLW
jgi:hypothetical protein